MGWVADASSYVIPLLVCFIFIWAAIKKVPAFESFAEGGKEGVSMAVSIIPFLVGMMVAITVLRASGALDALVGLIQPVLDAVHIPAAVLPLALIRPLSGTASLGMTSSLTAQYGPDSYIGHLAALVQGTSDTTFYVLTVYFGAVGIKRMGYALKVGLLADLCAFIISLVVAALVFGS